jgi:hypothetical protein
MLRLVGDIEKLIKKKIEIEPFELDESRPRRGDEPSDRVQRGEHRAARRSRDDDFVRLAKGNTPLRPGRMVSAASSDPLFDKPYEAPPQRDEAPAWGKGPRRGASGVEDAQHPGQAQGRLPARRQRLSLRRSQAPSAFRKSSRSGAKLATSGSQAPPSARASLPRLPASTAGRTTPRQS